VSDVMKPMALGMVEKQLSSRDMYLQQDRDGRRCAGDESSAAHNRLAVAHTQGSSVHSSCLEGLSNSWRTQPGPWAAYAVTSVRGTGHARNGILTKILYAACACLRRRSHARGLT
jgi:hypothetical protein